MGKNPLMFFVKVSMSFLISFLYDINYYRFGIFNIEVISNGELRSTLMGMEPFVANHSIYEGKG
jgi:hypothetical protein